jgi:CDP-diacylglycerol--glycerol-3-phosphate 3-phosphatidyltransferase
VILGIITQLEGLAASLILPQWTHDVLTIYHAYQIRQQLVKD